jgi:hypothetical protein
MIATNKVARVEITLGLEPVADAEIEKMNDILKNLAPIFEAEFWGGTQGADGNLEWTEPILAEGYMQHDTYAEWFTYRVPPDNVELEVGFQNGSKTLMSLLTGQGLARFPYGSEKITILLPVSENWEMTPSEKHTPTLFDHAAGYRDIE